jgi:cytochrome c
MNIELNKIAGALLGSLLLVVSVQVAADLIFEAEKPEKPGFVIPVATATPAAPAAAARPPVPAEPIGVILAKADATRGQAAFRQCGSCHTVAKGGNNGVGPNLWGVIAGPKAHLSNFRYSTALAGRGTAGEKWGFEELYKFLESPRGYLAGTSMSFAGVRSSQERADIIAFLRTQADTPAPLPTP